jgi:hypothetical protein
LRIILLPGSFHLMKEINGPLIYRIKISEQREVNV